MTEKLIGVGPPSNELSQQPYVKELETTRASGPCLKWSDGWLS
jgi:hypothetical protein